MGKKLLLWAVTMAGALFLLPWLAVQFGGGGLLVSLLLLFVANPICAGLTGVLAAGDVKKLWPLPLLFDLLFAAGFWLVLGVGPGELAFYLAVYLVIGYGIMAFFRAPQKR